MNDEEFAEKMRVKLGLARAKPAADPDALLKISLQNFARMVEDPDTSAVVRQHGKALSFDVATRLPGTKDLTVMRRNANAVVTVTGGDHRKVAEGYDVEGQRTVTFDVELYRSLDRRLPPADYLIMFLKDVVPRLIKVTMPKNARLVYPKSSVGDWYIDCVDADMSVLRQMPKVPYMLDATTDGDRDRATIQLARNLDYVDHHGKVMTPWGLIDHAQGDPVIIPGSDLDKMTDFKSGDVITRTVTAQTMRDGLTQPAFDNDAIRAIVAAQRVVVEVSLCPER